MDREEITLLTDFIITANGAGIGDRCQRNGIAEPKVIWTPSDSHLHDDALKFLLQYWQRVARQIELPTESQFKFSSTGPALGNLMVLDVVEDGWDYTYFYYGSEIQARSGFDMTGQRTSQINTTNYIPIFFISCYRAVLERKEALYTVHKPPNTIAAEEWRRLILPFTGESGDVSRIVVGNVPGKWRAKRSGRDAAWADWFDSQSGRAG